MTTVILELALAVAQIIDKNQKGFFVKVQEQVNRIKDEYNSEIGKSYSLIDAAKLDSLEYELRNLEQLLRAAIQEQNNSIKP